MSNAVKRVGKDGRPVRSALSAAVWERSGEFMSAAWVSLAINLLMLAPTVYMMEVYDRVINSRSPKTLLLLLALVLFLYAVTEALDLVRSGILERASLAFDRSIRMRCFDSMHEARRLHMPGGTPQVINDLRVVRDFMASQAVTAFLDAPVALIFLVMVFFIHPSMAVFALIGAAIQAALAVRTEKQTGQPMVEAGQASMAAQHYYGESLRNAEVITAMGMSGGIFSRWVALQRRFLSLQATASDHAGGSAAVSKMVQMAQGSLMLGLGCWLSLLGVLSGGGSMMIVASVLGGRMLAPMVQLIAQWKLVVTARDSYERLEGLLEAVQVRDKGMRLPAPAGFLSVEAVVAGAPGGGPPILRGVSFRLSPGECLAVVGPSAAGKSTLARLLVGVWGAASGKVRLDGADVFAWDKSELGPHLGYLPQSIELFDGTVAENIARFEAVDLEEVRAAARLVDMEGLVQGLPDGYDTRVGEGGAFLSGGQRQRIGLARAVYRRPRLVVLDEPNSSLDERGNAALVATLRALKESGATVVIITHSVQPLAAADKVLVLRDGAVQAFGPRDDVLKALSEASRKSAPAQAQAPALTPSGATA